MKAKKIILSFLILLCCLIHTGCYDSKDIDEMVYVVAIGIDEADNQNIKFTFQMALPLNISGGVEAGLSAERGSAPLSNITIAECDLYSAIDKINMNISKEINISHCKLLLFSEECAKNGLERFKRILTDDKELRPGTYIAVCSGNASDCLGAVSSPYELNPARYYDLMFDDGHSSYSSSVYLKNIYDTVQLTAPYISAQKDDIRKRGTAIFRDLKMKDVLSPDETLYFNMLCGSFRGAGINFPDGQILSVHQRKAPTIKADVKNRKIDITLHLYGQNASGGSKSAAILPQSAKKYIADSCSNVIKKSMLVNSDIVGLKNYVRKHFITSDEFEKFDFDSIYNTFDIKISVS